jgi:hypothetical protein
MEGLGKNVKICENCGYEARPEAIYCAMCRSLLPSETSAVNKDLLNKTITHTVTIEHELPTNVRCGISV